MQASIGRRLLSSAVVAGLLGALVALPAATQAAPGKSQRTPTNHVYIVQLAEMPVTAYQGGIKGLQATRPKKGQKIDPNAPEVVSYMAYLASQQDKAMASVGASKKLYSYGYVFNGFAAELSAEQAAKLAMTKGVVAVTKDEARPLDTATTPDFVGLTAPGGAWSQVKGENVIIGIVDGGIWPEHPSFSDRTGSNGNAAKDGKLAYQQIPGWNGKCTPGEAFTGSDCNQKLIGARYYNSGWGGNAGIDATLPWEFNSPRDFGGHGTHTASTSGGNQNVPATGLAAAFGSINGIAPRARIAAYKVCWETGDGGSCFNSDSVAAIDQAVADGVDVINFSISGSRTSFRDPVEIAFLYAADAGVFVAASAGNSGPTTSTVAHPGPWLTTVAAGTHNRVVQGGSVTLGNGETYAGAGNVTPVGPKPLVDGAQSGLADADANLALCFGADDDGNPRLDPAKVAGKIVVCERGGNVLVNKALAVKAAGGVGMVLVNTPTSANTTPFVSYSIPTVHLPNTAYAAVKAYAAAAGATATINGADILTNAAAPFTASFSSRGPLLAGSGDVLKPDLIAPGQDILAAVAPPGNGGALFDLYSGTSMSSPHVAGIAALMKEKHPDWSPMAIKSALMTTAYDVLDATDTATRLFRQGAGHVRPNSALDPGVVYDSGFTDWLNFICGTQPGSFCSAFKAIDPSDLNQASIAVGAMAGVQKVKRRLTNVSGKALTLSPSISGLDGIAVSVSPANLSIAPGKTAEFEVTFRTDGAALNIYTGGFITWSGNGYNTRSPVVIKPVALAAPAEVSAAPGGDSFPVTFGFDGDFTATARGLVPAALTDGTVDQDPDQTFSPNDPTGTTLVRVDVPAGTTYVRFALFDADVAAGSDIDLYVYRGNGSPVGGSGNGGSNEEVNDTAPVAGSYYVFIHGWGLPSGTSSFKLHAWALGSTNAGNMTVTAPATGSVGVTGTIKLDFSHLAPATKYLGSVVYGGAAGLPNPTIVRVDQP